MLAALLPLVGMLPTFTLSGVIGSADGPLHIMRIHAMTLMLQSGELWPRWVPYFHLGYGYPIFNFYPPGVFYLGGLLGLLGISAQTAFTVVAALAWSTGSVGMYVLARRFIPGRAALLAAMLWAYAPSRLYEVWDQGSLPQMLAAAAVPWLFYGITRAAFQPSRRAALIVALPLAAIILTHQPITFITALFAAPLALILPLWASCQDRTYITQRFAAVFGGLALGVGLATIFLLPLFTELQYVQAAAGTDDNVAYLLSNYLQPQEIFAQPQAMDLSDMRYELPTTFGLIGGLLTVPGAITLFRRRQYGLLLLLLLALAVTLFMLVEQSLPVWLTIPLFRQLRFSERFLRVGVVFLSLLGGASILLLPRRVQLAGLLAALALVLVAALPMAYPSQRTLDWGALTAVDEIEFELDRHIWGTTSYNEFNPLWGETTSLDRPRGYRDYAEQPLHIKVESDDLPTDVQIERLDDAAIRISTPNEQTLSFRQYYFPGWTATLDGQPADIYPEAHLGLITLDVPPGEHTIALDYTGTTAQHIGAAITAASLIIALALFATGRSSQTISSPKCELLDGRAFVFVSGGIIAFALVNLFVFTPMLFFRITSPPDSPAYMQTRLDTTFGNEFTLLGYTLNQDSVNPGGLLNVTLYWRVQHDLEAEYRPIVQLANLSITESWAVRQPFFPGSGQTTGWLTDQFMSDVHEMRVIDTAPPYVGRIMVQMVEAQSGEPLHLPDGSDRLLLEPLIRVNGTGEPARQVLNNDLGGVVQLWCASVTTQDDQYMIDLYWHVTQTPNADLVTLVHGLDVAGELVEQGDGPPLAGNYPTSLWLPGQTLHDVYTLPQNPNIASIAIGLYAPSRNNERLAVTQDSQPVPDNIIRLSLIEAQCSA
ncbi:MAG: hypothetical protein H7175_23830 [Burkholderiales bacterium]|nr:hypothetical protein [Anaerolineae bacterium]